MKFSRLSEETQEGLRRWAKDQLWDESFWDGIDSSPADWAFAWFRLRVAEDRPRWFPRGKWATLQVIEDFLLAEARRLL